MRCRTHGQTSCLGLLSPRVSKGPGVRTGYAGGAKEVDRTRKVESEDLRRALRGRRRSVAGLLGQPANAGPRSRAAGQETLKPRNQGQVKVVCMSFTDGEVRASPAA